MTSVGSQLHRKNLQMDKIHVFQMLNLMLSVQCILWFKEFTNKILSLMGEERTFQPSYVAE
jgi:hypothetical protein